MVARRSKAHLSKGAFLFLLYVIVTMYMLKFSTTASVSIGSDPILG